MRWSDLLPVAARPGAVRIQPGHSGIAPFLLTIQNLSLSPNDLLRVIMICRIFQLSACAVRNFPDFGESSVVLCYSWCFPLEIIKFSFADDNLVTKSLLGLAKMSRIF